VHAIFTFDQVHNTITNDAGRKHRKSSPVMRGVNSMDADASQIVDKNAN
jgi:hypothetical protein